jgi:hypothetical protein
MWRRLLWEGQSGGDQSRVMILKSPESGIPLAGIVVK